MPGWYFYRKSLDNSGNFLLKYCSIQYLFAAGVTLINLLFSIELFSFSKDVFSKSSFLGSIYQIGHNTWGWPSEQLQLSIERKLVQWTFLIWISPLASSGDATKDRCLIGRKHLPQKAQMTPLLAQSHARIGTTFKLRGSHSNKSSCDPDLDLWTWFPFWYL